MSKLTKIREILFDKSEYVLGEVTLRYGKGKTVYIKSGPEEFEKQQNLFVLTDISHMSTVYSKERCYCDIKLNSGVVVSIYGSNEEAEYLFSNLHSRWIECRNESDKLRVFKTIVKFFGVLLLIWMLAGVILNKSGSDSLATAHIPTDNKIQLDTIAPPSAHPEDQNDNFEAKIVASKIAQQARPNAELAALLKKGAVTNDYSVKIGESKQKKPVFYVFSDPLCPHCRNIEPLLEKLADTYVIDIFPVSKIGRDRSKPIVETVLCNKPEDRETLWKEAISGNSGTNNPCPVGNAALTNNNTTFSAFSFIGTPTVIRGDGAVFPLTKKLNESNLNSWLKGEF